MEISKLTLGTAQLGLNYGIANISGKPDFNTATRILKYAWNAGLRSFDTSPQYGNSEKIIGKFIKSNDYNKIENLVIISKLPEVRISEKITYDSLYNHIKNQINKSLIDLEIEQIPIYLLHHPDDIFLEDGLAFECLNQIKKEGLIQKFGTSVYYPKEVKATLNYKNCNVIQVPINIFDHRLINTGLLERLKKRGYIILARAIFLQGLFFLSPKRLSKKLEIAIEPLSILNNLLKEYKIDVAKLAFLFIRDLPEVSSMVIGVERVEQIAQNISLLNENPLSDELYNRIIDNFSDLPENLINPHLWNK